MWLLNNRLWKSCLCLGSKKNQFTKLKPLALVLFGINMLNNSLTGIENMSKMVSPDTDTAKFLNTFSLHFNIVVPAKQN